MRKALLIIDLQKDYFPAGKYPLWNAEEALARIERAAEAAKKHALPVILVQHVADPAKGPAPFFNRGTEGAGIHPRLMAVAPDAPIIVKGHADSFYNTTLAEVLEQDEIQELFVCGMMTQNCVTHTAISKSAEQFKVSVIGDCCTTVDQMIHIMALNALSTRVEVIDTATFIRRI